MSDAELLKLLERLFDGDTSAFETLSDVLEPVMHWEAGKMLRKWASGPRDGERIRQLVRDLVQESWIALIEKDYRALREWRPETLPLKAWVGYLTRRRAAQFLRSPRSQLREPTVPDDEIPPRPSERTPERIVLGDDLLQKVYLCLMARSSAVDMDTFDRLFLLEQSTAEIRAATGRSSDAIYQCKHRLRDRAEACREQVTS